MSYLSDLIHDIVEGDTMQFHTTHVHEGERFYAYPLSGGAELWWSSFSRRLMALRTNRSLQAKEPSTFETYIKKAGYRHSRARAIQIEGDLNNRIGVVWLVGQADEPDHADAQTSLLDLIEGGDADNTKA